MVEEDLHESDDCGDLNNGEGVFCFSIYLDPAEVYYYNDGQEDGDGSPAWNVDIPVLEGDCCCHNF